MSEMIERVAKAIYETEPFEINLRASTPWEDVHESQKEGFRVKARAAIEAMREPTEAMKECLWGLPGDPWSDVIDAALKVEVER